MSALKIIDPGLLTTVQDFGRGGAQRYGVPVSGVRDREAMVLANALVGAPIDQAVLELGYVGPAFLVQTDTLEIALVGAEMQIEVMRDGETRVFPDRRTIPLKRGDRVRCGALRGAPSACLALSCGVDLPLVLNSQATFAKGSFGGFRGRALAQGDRLPLGGAMPPGQILCLPAPFPAAPAQTIRVVLGPQEDHFTPEAVETFLTRPWQVTQEADRMGLRLDGPRLSHAKGYNVTSDAIVTGSIQVPGSGQPIIMLVDRQTSGGYPKIATVITADLPALARFSPGASFHFAAVSASEGAHLARARAAEMAELLASIAPWRPSGQIDEAALYRENLISPPILD